MVPAGSVYFFHVIQGSAENFVPQCWLRSVSDARQDRLDGYGLALWGTWSQQGDKQ
jgi:hypothetical protein